MSQVILTDGQNAKGINPWDLDDRPEAWTWLSGANDRDIENMFYKVAASFRAVNKRAVAASAVPFTIMKGKDVYDDSNAWENKVGFLPKPKDLIRRVSLSLTFKNKAYLLRGKNVLGVTKSLRFLVPTTILEVTSPVTGDIDYFERNVNGRPQRYTADDPSLIKIWILDHTTELLPSKNTAAQAIFNATGQLFFTDLFIKNFYERGGVKPVILTLKGAIWKDKKEDIERGWDRFVKNISRFSAKIFNAEAMDIKPFGTGVDDLKNNEVYRQAIENIALGIGMPTSHLLSDWSNYATAEVDYMMWQRDDIFPLCEQIDEDLNEQIFAPLGLRIVHNTDQVDTETEDEVARAQSLSTYMDYFAKCPNYEVWESTCLMFSYELTDAAKDAARAYFAKKEAPVEVQPQNNQAPATPQETQVTTPKTPAKWTPSLDQLNELRVYRKACLQRYKRQESLDFEYLPHYGGLPEPFMDSIKSELARAGSEDDIRRIFDIEFETETATPAPEYKESELLILAEAMNNLAAKSTQESQPIVVVNNQKPKRRTRLSEIFIKNAFEKGDTNGRPSTD